MTSGQEIQTQNGCVGSTNATSVLCSPTAVFISNTVASACPTLSFSVACVVVYLIAVAVLILVLL